MNQLLEIVKNFLAITLFLSAFGVLSQSYQSDLDSIESLIKINEFETAKSFALDAKIRNDERAGSIWLTKSNLLLGDLYSEEDDFAKAIIHYLEGIRYSKNADQEIVGNNVSSLYFRIGAMFARFRSYELAEQYHLEGLEYAKLHNLPAKELNHKYALAGVFRDDGRYTEAIDLLLESLSNREPGARLYFSLHNILGLTYHDAKQFENSIDIFEKIVAELPEENWRFLGSYYHNLARSYRESKNHEKALLNYQKAVEYKQLAGSNKALFSSYYGLAETHYSIQDFDNSEKYFLTAENLLDLQSLHPDNFDIYKACANLNYELGDYRKSKHYEDLFAAKMDEYLEIQAEIQETDQRYNMELITKRYFAEVDKQERVATLLMYSKLTSGGLFALLIIVIAYHRYQKIRLRKSIERELIALKIVE